MRLIKTKIQQNNNKNITIFDHSIINDTNLNHSSNIIIVIFHFNYITIITLDGKTVKKTQHHRNTAHN